MSPFSARSASTVSAGGQELQPWLVNSSTTPLGFNMSPAKDGTAQTTAAAAAIRSKSLLFMGVPVPPVWPARFRLPECLPDRPHKRKSRCGENPEKRIASPLRILFRASGREIAQHVLQDAAVPEVFEFVDRIDAAEDRHVLHRAVAIGDAGRHLLARADLLQPVDRHRLVALEAER